MASSSRASPNSVPTSRSASGSVPSRPSARLAPLSLQPAAVPAEALAAVPAEALAAVPAAAPAQSPAASLAASLAARPAASRPATIAVTAIAPEHRHDSNERLRKLGLQLSRLWGRFNPSGRFEFVLLIRKIGYRISKFASISFSQTHGQVVWAEAVPQAARMANPTPTGLGEH